MRSIARVRGHIALDRTFQTDSRPRWEVRNAAPSSPDVCSLMARWSRISSAEDRVPRYRCDGLATFTASQLNREVPHAHHHLRRSRRISRAALCPGTPPTPPPGCADAPH